ncbi:G-protein coupled receptor [Gossypium arboreum]|uniref:G-protein coupled receptor n=1 Tax=Gossypium arboreum TaxID=29729 RepID=A0A0B0PXT8_GOSAR|nr:G-protein coupled receptor [Gossypium arboreum]
MILTPVVCTIEVNLDELISPKCTAEKATLTRGELLKHPGHSRNKWFIVSALSPHQGQLVLVANFIWFVKRKF